MWRRPSSCLVLLVLMMADPVQAGRPLQTEDAGVLARGECELEVPFARTRAPDVKQGHVQAGCGIGLDSQLALLLGRSDAADERSDLAGVVGKTSLVPLTEERTGVTIAWALGFQRPRGGSVERDALEVRAVVTHPIGPWLLHGNLGWQRDHAAHRNSTIWGAAAERTGLGPVDAMFEFFGDDRDKPWLNAGLRWNVVPGTLSFDGSYGRQLGHGDASLVTLGAKLSF